MKIQNFIKMNLKKPLTIKLVYYMIMKKLSRNMNVVKEWGKYE